MECLVDADYLILSMAELMGMRQTVCLAFLFSGGSQRWKKRSSLDGPVLL